MFRRVLVLILFLSLFCASSMADPLELRESLSNDIVYLADDRHLCAKYVAGTRLF